MIETQRIRDVVQLGPLPNATLYEIIDELGARACALDQGGRHEIADHVRVAIDMLRIVASEIVAIRDAAAAALVAS